MFTAFTLQTTDLLIHSLILLTFVECLLCTRPSAGCWGHQSEKNPSSRNFLLSSGDRHSLKNHIGECEVRALGSAMKVCSARKAETQPGVNPCSCRGPHLRQQHLHPPRYTAKNPGSHPAPCSLSALIAPASPAPGPMWDLITGHHIPPSFG